MKNLKTIKVKFKLILLGVILSVVSCAKDDEVQVENLQKFSIVNQINKLSESYIQNPGRADTDWGQVARADVAAGLIESGDPSSTMISVTLVAATASVKEYNSQQTQTVSSISNGGQNGSNTGQTEANETNPYDSYGYWHYASIDNVLVDPKLYLNGEDFDNELFYEATIKFLSKNDVGSDSDYENLTLDLVNEKLAFSTEVFDHYGLSGGLTYLLEIGNIQESVYEVMLPYYSVLENVNSSEEFVDYSLQVEELVLDSELEEKEKEIVLSTMATARYGIQYWSSVFGDY